MGGLIWRIGNGKPTRILEDKWLPNPSTYRVQSPPTLLKATTTVSQLFDESGQSWKYSLLDQLFTAEESSLIKTIPISTTNQEDRLIWRDIGKGLFSVKSAYNILKEWELAQEAKSSSQQKCNKVWKALWQLQIPQVEKVCFGRACMISYQHEIGYFIEKLFKIRKGNNCPYSMAMSFGRRRMEWRLYKVSKKFLQ